MITPKDAIELYKNNKGPRIQIMIEHIDAAIRTQFKNGAKSAVCYGPGFDSDMVVDIISHYKKLGWHIKHKRDEHFRNYLCLYTAGPKSWFGRLFS